MHSDDNPRRRFLKKAGMVGAGIPLAIAGTAAPAAGEKSGHVVTSRYDVRQFGAHGDGNAIDSAAINRAIDAAAAAGGGTVHFPAGKYLSYSIHLKSNVGLYLDHGAVIIAADPAKDVAQSYDLAESNMPWEDYQDFGHNHWHNSLIWGEGLHNVSICGPGLIWGRGLSRGWGTGPVAETPGVANKSIALKNCRNVLLRDFSILHGGHFGILATGVDNFAIDNLKLDTNRDGMDIDCCRNVRVSNCTVNSPWDDGICLKSSYALGYARSTEMVTITNCMVSGSYEEGSVLDGSWKKFPPGEKVSRTGRIKFGTESNGGFKNITISNCVFDGCRGLAIESVDGAVIEDVACTNITMRDVYEAPIFIRLGARMRGPAGIPVGAIRRVILSDITCISAEHSPKIAAILAGIPGHAIEDVKISNLIFVSQGGGTKDEAPAQVPEKENQYPEPNMFGTTPAWGFFLRHVNKLEMDGAKLEPMKPDARPAFVLDDVDEAAFGKIKAQTASGVPTFSLKDVRDVTVYRSKPIPDTEIESAAQKDI